MKIKEMIFLVAICIGYSLNLQSQDEIVEYNFKKGEVIDILLLNQKKGSGDVLKRYFEVATPIAVKNGYQPKPAFPIIEPHLQGNYHPGLLIFASWPSVKVRKETLLELESTLDDFHDMRRAIWSTFNVAYYKVAEDLNFSIDKSRYNVVTAYWSKSGNTMEKYMSTWRKLVSETSGSLIVELTDAMSVFGYVYKPDYFIISSWENKEDFDAFKAKNIMMDHKEVEQVHQFKLQ